MRTAQPAGGGRLLRRAAGNVHSGRRVVFALLCTLLSPAAGAHWLASSGVRRAVLLTTSRAPRARSAPRADAASTVITGIATASNVVTGVGSLALVVAIHELGHFSAAVAQGITVKEFSVGFGPRIATLSPPNATFDVTLRALPLGGFVAFPRALTPEVRTEIETYQKGRREKRKKAAREARGGDGDLPAWRQLFAPFLPPPPPPPLPPLTGFAAVFAKFAPLPVATMAAELAVRQARSLVEAEAREDAELQLELAADPDDPDLLQNRPLGQQALVIGAGVFANAVLSWTLIFAAVSAYGVTSTEFRPEPAIVNVQADSPAFDAGLRRGDLIVSIDGTVLQGPAETAIDAALGRIKLRIEEGGPIELQLLRAAPLPAAPTAAASLAAAPTQPRTLAAQTLATPPATAALPPRATFKTAATPAGARTFERLAVTVTPSAGARIGVQLDRMPLRITTRKVSSPLEAVSRANLKTAELGKAILNELLKSFGALFKSATAGLLPGSSAAGKSAPAPGLQGPVALLSSAVTLAERGDLQLLAAFVATISLNVAVFNTLPVPGLDGGQMAFLAIDALTETTGLPRLDRRVKENVSVAFALLLSGLALSVLASDVGHALGVLK